MKIVTNPDKDFALKIREKLRVNDNHCPCKAEKTKETLCPCKEFRDKMERKELGSCHCQLFIITEND